MSTTGSLRGVTIDGIQYRVPADADVEIKLSPFETTSVPTSGETVFQMTIVSTDITAIPLSVTPDEADALKSSAEKTDDYDMSVVLANGQEYKAQGRIYFDNVTSAAGQANISMMPNNALGSWELF